MSTAQEIINGAARKVKLLAVGQTLESDIGADALTRLNRMVNRWRNDGIDLGLGTLTADSEVYVDDADLECIEANLQIRLANDYNRSIDPLFVAEVGTLTTELRAKYKVVQLLDLDFTLKRRGPYNIRTDSA